MIYSDKINQIKSNQKERPMINNEENSLLILNSGRHIKEYHGKNSAPVKTRVLLEILNKLYVYHKIMNYLNFNSWWRDIKGLETTVLNHDQEADMKTIPSGLLSVLTNLILSSWAQLMRPQVM
jgi:hypothetical protein